MLVISGPYDMTNILSLLALLGDLRRANTRSVAEKVRPIREGYRTDHPDGPRAGR